MLKQLQKNVIGEIEKASGLDELDKIYKKYLGRNGKLTLFFRSLKDLPEEERKVKGKLANEIKEKIKNALEEKSKKLQDSKKEDLISPTEGKLKKEWFDITAPGEKFKLGHLHPLTLIKREIIDIFQHMGFSPVEGPEIEDEWHNFDALNIQEDHPARDALSLGKTLYLKEEIPVKQKSKGKLLLRTHTSSVQIRYMEKNNPPFKIIAVGKIFRAEATDASHEINFYQVEGLMVDENVSVSNFKAIIQEFFKRFFKKPVKIRLRPSYFPFTEPSFEVDISCIVCQGKGCSVCKNTGWVEIMGAGMVHPYVFNSVKLNPKFWNGFAFGIGMDRLTMMKYKINDIRLFYSGDLRFLNQF